MGYVIIDAAQSHKVFAHADNGDLVWSSDFPPVNWMPQSAWTVLNNYTISFPDFQKGGGYGYARKRNDYNPSFQDDACITACTLLPQAWYSGWSTIGSVPAGCNVLDVRGNIVRTKAPDQVLGSGVSSLIFGGNGAQTVFVGGWCPIESEFSWTRVFEFRLQGTSVQIRRSHSTRAAKPGENPPWTTDYTANGWSRFGGGGSQNGALVGVIDEKSGGLAGSGERRRGGNNACSMNTSKFDFSSSYRANIVIRPGYIRP